jgi:hypothetical protein
MVKNVLLEKMLKSGLTKVLTLAAGALIAKSVIPSDTDTAPLISAGVEFLTGVILLLASFASSWYRARQEVVGLRNVAMSASNPQILTPEAALSQAAIRTRDKDVPAPITMTNAKGQERVV